MRRIDAVFNVGALFMISSRLRNKREKLRIVF